MVVVEVGRRCQARRGGWVVNARLVEVGRRRQAPRGGRVVDARLVEVGRRRQAHRGGWVVDARLVEVGCRCQAHRGGSRLVMGRDVAREGEWGRVGDGKQRGGLILRGGLTLDTIHWASFVFLDTGDMVVADWCCRFVSQLRR